MGVGNSNGAQQPLSKPSLLNQVDMTKIDPQHDGSDFYMVSSVGDTLFSVVCLVAMIAVVWLMPVERKVVYAFYAVWVLLLVRLHVHIWWLGAAGYFARLSQRFPNAWISTCAFLPAMLAFKWGGWILHQLNPIGDLGLRVFQCDGHCPLQRYRGWACDVEKPLVYRTGSTWWLPFLYVGFGSPYIMINIYTVGPLMVFGCMTMVHSEETVFVMNGMFGTHPVVNGGVALTFSPKGQGHIFTNLPAMWPWNTIYTFAWENHSQRLNFALEEWAQRTNEGTVICDKADVAWRRRGGSIFGRERNELVRANLSLCCECC